MTANQTKKFGVGIMGASLALMLSISSASAATYNFFKITDNSDLDVGSQLSVEVLGFSPTLVSFTFKNNVGIASSIADIYFDDAVPQVVDDPITFAQSAGVSFSSGASPGDLPGRNEITPNFATTDGLSADSDSPVAPNGVNAMGEYVTLYLNYTTGNSIATVLAALANGSLRIGLHVQAIGATAQTDGDSDGYINNRFTRPNEATVVPIPAALPLLLGGMGGLAWLARRQKRRGSAA